MQIQISEQEPFVTNSSDHSFAICAYGESPYLCECIESVLNQTCKGSEVYIATSTPSSWLDEIARKYNLNVYVNDGEHGIGQDWNYAYSVAKTKFVTIAHQDDIYCEEYAQNAVEMLSSLDDSLIFFSNYGELRNGSKVDENKILNVKRRLLKPLKDGKNAKSARARRRALSLGNAISCPSVTFNRDNCPNPPFHTKMKCSLDWDTWEHLSRSKGAFLYSSKILMYHRIHGESTTTSLIENRTRAQEDFEMLKRFWPTPIARIINHFYSASEKSNNL